ncbi:MAG: hypothetical protein J7605_01475 [Variovorax sp.]|nr:hypothetical protein [Variovorax sp.]
MEKESKSGGSGLPANGMVAVALLIAGALFVREVPLEATRPPSGEPRVAQHFSLQDIDARLWQDPFGAVARGRAEERKAKPERDPTTIDASQRAPGRLADEIRRRVVDQKQPVEILAVMLGGGPYADSVESRRRVRYAVLAGLGMSNLTPVDNEHLGYYLPVKDPQGKVSVLPESVPYEWFEPAAANVGLNTETRPAVLVMWLQAEAFSDQPLTRMRDLANPFVGTGAGWRVLGPWDSDGLKEMIAEVLSKDTSKLFEGMNIRFYSQFATVPDGSLLSRVVEKRKARDDSPLTLSDFFADKGVSLVRTIGDDGLLTDGLIGELELRGLHPAKLQSGGNGQTSEFASYRDACRPEASGRPNAPTHIAIVAEWDSLYGRSLKREFKAATNEKGFCVEDRFTYVRGLDGLLPNAGVTASTDGKQAASDKEAPRRKDGTFIERAEGQSQFDYLRRLAVQLHERDQSLRRAGGKNSGLRAIGVLGNDVHDKLVVLQALQPEFPDAIFFTTDLDARMLHPREQAWARNLVVASNFGLRLAPDVQKGAPPFRDSYQTSAFFATQLAMEDMRRALRKASYSGAEGSDQLTQADISRWFTAPRIFEIGRTAAFDLSGRPTFDSECAGRIAHCDSIHPSVPVPYPELRAPTVFALMSLVALGLWAPALMLPRGRQTLLQFLSARTDRKGRSLRYGGLLLAFVLVQVVLPAAVTVGWQPFVQWVVRDGKPFVALEGISMWPTEGIRLVTLVLCVHLVFRGWMLLSQNLDSVGRELGILQTREELIAEQGRIDEGLRPWEKFVRMFSMSFHPPSAPKIEPGHGLPADSIALWRRHIVQNRLSARLTRTTVCVLLALGLSCFVVMALGEDSFVPYRGKLSLRVHESLCLLTAVATYFLVFFVVDATVLCVRYVHGLREQTAMWPSSTLEAFEKQLGVRANLCLDDWIDLRYVALRTRCVTRLVYYPFIVMSLLLVSRSWIFDHWSMPVSTIVLTGISAAIMIACVVALQLAAEKSREVALARIRDLQMRMNRRSPAPEVPAISVKQLELLYARIDCLHEGAFAPFWQQPLPKAVLLPMATLAGTTLFDYTAFANL